MTENLCWCGSGSGSASPHEAYLVCRSCGTARLRAPHMPADSSVEHEDDHLYGRGYWDAGQSRLGYPRLEVRARADMAQRVQYWLHYILKYRLPPGRAFEVGCAHGGLVRLLGLAGFDALGMEMSPSIVDAARRWFGVDVIQGPIEAIDCSRINADVAVLMDVLEHFVDPVRSLSKVITSAAADAIFVIQTPCYEDVNSREWRHFIVPDHTFLFSRDSVRALLSSVGIGHVVFEPALFSNDMFLIASRVAVTPPERAAWLSALEGTPDGRMVLTMQDLYWRRQQDVLDDRRHVSSSELVEMYGVRRLMKALTKGIPEAVLRVLRRAAGVQQRNT